MASCALYANNIRDIKKTLAFHSQTGKHRDLARELEQNWTYVFGSVIFAIGSLLYLPSIYEGVANEDTCIKWGTILFVAGSCCFIVATVINAITVSVHGTWLVQELTTKLALASLWCSLVGGTMYAVGSVLFFPQIDGSGSKWNTVNLGTHYFVAGGSGYLAGAIINLALVVVKHSKENHPHHEVHKQLTTPPATVAYQKCTATAAREVGFHSSEP